LGGWRQKALSKEEINGWRRSTIESRLYYGMRKEAISNELRVLAVTNGDMPTKSIKYTTKDIGGARISQEGKGAMRD